MKNIYLAGAVRTAIGRFGGALAGMTAAELGAVVAAESLRRAGVSVDDVREVIWGSARQAGVGPNVARQISFRAGFPETVPASTINQACGSGLKAIILAAQEIMLGRATTVVLAGGVESMSRVPTTPKARGGACGWENSGLVKGCNRDGCLDHSPAS